MTIVARNVKMITSNVLMNFTGKRLYSGVGNLVNFNMEKESSASSDLGLDFCVRTYHSKRNLSSWHLINRNKKAFVPPLPLGCDPPRDLYSATSSGSKVYISGGFEIGCESAKKEVFCMDTHHPEKGWKELTPMKCERSLHRSTFFGEKMYVWGDFKRHEFEVYDKNLNKWDFLDKLPEEVDLRGIGSTWISPYNVLGIDYSMACVGGMVYALYQLGPGNLLAYDPSGPSAVKTVANSSKLHEYLPQWQLDEYFSDYIDIPEHFLIPLGDDILGVVWLDTKVDKELWPELKKVGWAGSSNLRCSKFRMKHTKSNGRLKFFAEPLDRFSCLILGTRISNCVAVEPLLPRDEVVPEEVKMENLTVGNVKTKREVKVISEQAKKKNGKRENVKMEREVKVISEQAKKKKGKRENVKTESVDKVISEDDKKNGRRENGNTKKGKEINAHA